MSHVDDKLQVLDVELTNAVYLEPAFPGDTFRKTFTVIGLRPTTDQKRTVIDIRCDLTNQHNQRVFTVDKRMLIPVLSSTKNHITPSKNKPKPPYSKFREQVINKSNSSNSQSLTRLETQQIFLHGLTRPIGFKINNIYIYIHILYFVCFFFF